MQGKLTKLDEWPRHQAATTFDVVTSDSPHWSDGYYFCVGDETGQMQLFTAIRLHPNNDVLEGYACVTTGGSQANMRWSRRLRPAIDDLRVGPLELEISEPLEQLRTTCVPNRYGIAFDIDWTGLHTPYLEDYRSRVENGRSLQSRCNYGQVCAVDGWVEVGDKRFEITGDSWVGVRDHSWGIGPTGGPAWPHAAPLPGAARAIFDTRSWSMFRLPDRVVFFMLHRYAEHAPVVLEHREIMLDGGASRSAVTAEFRVTPVPGHRRARTAQLSLVFADGDEQVLDISVVGDPTHLQGGGYFQGFDDGLGRGVYRGDDHHEGEVWDVSLPSRINDPRGLVRERPDAWAENWAVCEMAGTGLRGVGHFECVLAGERWGVTEAHDG